MELPAAITRRRGRKSAKLPDGVEGRPEGETDDGKVRCQTCLLYSPMDYHAEWILRGSLAIHLKSMIHGKSADLKAAADSAAENTRAEQVQHTNDFAVTQNFVLESQAAAPSGSSKNPSVAEQAMWEGYAANRDDYMFEMDEGSEEVEARERKEFEDRYRAYGIWNGGEQPVNPETMDNAEDLWDEAEQDDVLAEILRNMAIDQEESQVEDGTSDNINISPAWYPYSSKLEFLLDTIDNLPRLRIAGSMMRVILWLLHKLGVKHIPSFDRLRKVQREVRSQAGVPTINWMSPKGNAFSFNDPNAIIANSHVTALAAEAEIRACPASQPQLPAVTQKLTPVGLPGYPAEVVRWPKFEVTAPAEVFGLVQYTNPIVAPQIHPYPVIPTNGVVSEVYHAEKWRHGLDRHILSPMYDGGNERHFFIDEPASLRDGRLVMPIRWLSDEKGGVWADAWEIKTDSDTLSTVLDQRVILIEAIQLEKCMLDLECDKELPTQWSAETIAAGHQSRMPNPDRALAEGDPIYTSFIDIFGDDVSGNRSKSWNKHLNIYITHRNLPRKLLNQQMHTHFISTSTHASVPEQFEGIKNALESTHRNPVKVRNPATGTQTRFKIFCNCEPGDNPAQSEASGHIGGNGNHPCRKCDAGGSQRSKESEAGFHALFSPGNPRSAEATLQSVEEQVRIACLGVAQPVKDLQTDTGVKDAFTQSSIDDLILRAKAMQKGQPPRSKPDVQAELMTWVDANQKLIYNPFLTMKGFDAARDTPVEILHTILLGVAKYSWFGCHSTWNAAHQKSYSTRLQATNVSGLSIHPIRANYIMQYANSLIGRQLKTLAQVNAFHIYDLVDSLQFQLTKAIGELSALLWITEIHNLDQYLIDVEIAAANVLDIAALIDPTKIIAKIKYHLLLHLREDIIRFGPLVGVATEVFESFNAIFRLCSILSNHLAPSRDISRQLAQQETTKHLLSGGWWKSKDGSWVRSGSSVRSFIDSDPFLRTLVGWADVKLIIPGTVKLLPLKRGEDKKLQKRVAYRWQETSATEALNVAAFPDEAGLQWYKGKHVIAQSEDRCMEGSWIFCSSPLSSTAPPVTGRIIEILQDTTEKRSLVLLDVFAVAGARHDLFGMPVLVRRLGEKSLLIIPAKTILFEYNVQHDCKLAGCVASGKRPVVQERLQTELTEAYIEHKPLDRFIINTHAFHNAHLLRQVLPRDLTSPLPFTADRKAHHDQISMGLRASQSSKRSAAALKAAEEKKVKEKAMAASGASGSTGPKKRKRAPTTVTRSGQSGAMAAPSQADDADEPQAQSDLDGMDVDEQT